MKITADLHSLTQTTSWGSNVSIVSINLDEMPEIAAKYIKAEGLISLNHYHIGSSSADLEFGGVKMPRILLVDKEGTIVYLGQPKSIDVKLALDTLSKGDPIFIQPELLTEDEVHPHGDTSSTFFCRYNEMGTFSETPDLTQIRNDMDEFPSQIAQIVKDHEALRSGLSSLESDHVMLLRETRVNPDSGTLLTKCLQIFSLAGPEQALSDVRSQLNSLLTGTGGSFLKEWDVTVVSA